MVKNVKEQFQNYGSQFMEGIKNDKGELIGATNKKFLKECKLSKEDEAKQGKTIGEKSFPDYQACIKVSTEESLREMVKPAMLVIFSPILTGAFFGVEAVSGLLVGSLISAVQLAISQSNSGGAWDNAKKFVECGDCKAIGPDGTRQSGQPYTKKSKPDAGEVHAAAVVGDTVGDPLKDTSGPALNIVMK